MLDEIRAVFSDPQTPGLDRLYDAINAARDLAPDSDFEACYDIVMAAAGPEAEAWIAFTVHTATRFDLDHQPDPEQFLQVLDRVRHGALQARGLAHGVAEEQAAFDDDENGQRRAGVHQVEGQFVE